jgi:nucleoside-diphosphate-sugar epimerase
MAISTLSALIGHSGFVGTTLLRQRAFDCLYRSTNISSIANQSFDLVVCSGAPAQKWIANKEPERDVENIRSLMSLLQTIEAKTFVLISTVDVHKSPIGVDESAVIDESSLQPYGLHRRLLEKFVESTFKNHIIVRLPGLVGPGLRKNVIFDFLNGNNLSLIDSRGSFQFYPMVNLWTDLATAINNKIRLVHLASEPISVREIAASAFNLDFTNELDAPVASYDMTSRYAELFGGRGAYQYSRRDSILAIRSYAQSEPKVARSIT